MSKKTLTITLNGDVDENGFHPNYDNNFISGQNFTEEEITNLNTYVKNNIKNIKLHENIIYQTISIKNKSFFDALNDEDKVKITNFLNKLVLNKTYISDNDINDFINTNFSSKNNNEKNIIKRNIELYNAWIGYYSYYTPDKLDEDNIITTSNKKFFDSLNDDEDIELSKFLNNLNNNINYDINVINTIFPSRNDYEKSILKSNINLFIALNTKGGKRRRKTSKRSSGGKRKTSKYQKRKSGKHRQ